MLWVSGPLTPAQLRESEDRSSPCGALRHLSENLYPVHGEALARARLRPGFRPVFENSYAIVFYDRVHQLCQETPSNRLLWRLPLVGVGEFPGEGIFNRR